MKVILIPVVWLILLSTNGVKGQVNIFAGSHLSTITGYKLDNFKVNILAGIGYDHCLDDNQKWLLAFKIFYNQLGSLSSIYNTKDILHSDNISSAVGLSYQKTRGVRKLWVNLSPEVSYMYRLTSITKFREDDRDVVRIKLDPRHSNTSQWNVGLYLEAGHSFDAGKNVLGIAMYGQILFLDMLRNKTVYGIQEADGNNMNVASGIKLLYYL